MISLIRKLQELIPLGDAITILRVVIGIGVPPDPCEEGEFRIWIAKLLDALIKVTGLTSNDLDDKAVEVLKAAMETEEGWNLFYSVVMLLDPHDEQAPLVTGDAKAVAFAAKAGIDPVTVIAIVNTILELIKWWRNR